MANDERIAIALEHIERDLADIKTQQRDHAQKLIETLGQLVPSNPEGVPDIEERTLFEDAEEELGIREKFSRAIKAMKQNRGTDETSRVALFVDGVLFDSNMRLAHLAAIDDRLRVC